MVFCASVLFRWLERGQVLDKKDKPIFSGLDKIELGGLG
jgi:hypothetical protein